MLDHKGDFSDFDGWAYINCAFHGPLPRTARAALDLARELREHPESMRNDVHFTLPNAYRRAVSELVHCDPVDVAVTDSTTHGVMQLVHGFDWNPGDEVVLPRHEFPANKLPWLELERHGVSVRQVDVGLDGSVALERLDAAITSRTRIVSLAWVSYLSGRRIDLDAVSELCRTRGVLFAVDGSQGVGGLPLDLGSTRVDLLACSGYKWLLGPYGLGFTYFDRELAERLRPNNANWFSAEGAEDFNQLAELPPRYRPGAHRFDINETANPFNLAPAIASLRYLREIGSDAIERHCREFNEHVLRGLPERFRPLLSEGNDRRRSNILCITADDPQVTAAAFERLRAQRVHVSSRESSIRLSPHVYNDASDAERFLAAISDDGPPAPTAAPASSGLHERLVRRLGLEPLDPSGHHHDDN